ncbi:MAG: acetyl-CoA carboxylase biotin carboxyl carrier protein [Gammaproteobacteria bacterium]
MNPPTTERVAALVRSLAVVMCESAVTELDLDLGSLTVRLRRPYRNGADETAMLASLSVSEVPESRVTESDQIITAPMIGTFYTAPTPDARPFVREGDEIFIGQTIGIIEAMKIMNEIAADRSGTVERILVDNGQPVEYGSPLLRLAEFRGERA